MLSNQPTQDILRSFRNGKRIADSEVAAVEKLSQPCFPFAEALASAESIHVHIKVSDPTGLQVFGFGGP